MHTNYCMHMHVNKQFACNQSAAGVSCKKITSIANSTSMAWHLCVPAQGVRCKCYIISPGARLARCQDLLHRQASAKCKHAHAALHTIQAANDVHKSLRKAQSEVDSNLSAASKLLCRCQGTASVAATYQLQYLQPLLTILGLAHYSTHMVSSTGKSPSVALH